MESKQHPDRLPEVWAYEMCWDEQEIPVSDISCVPFAEEYFEEYKSIYNACFYPMRKALDIACGGVEPRSFEAI